MPNTTRIPERIANKFFQYCQQLSATGCWGWTGPRKEDGYGRLYTGQRGRYLRAHRVSYELFVGAIPNGMVVMHLCDNPICTNPRHLRAAPQSENVADAMRKGRGRHGTPPLQRKLTIEAVTDIRRGGMNDHQFAKRYSVSHDAIRHARIGKTWSGLQAAPSPTPTGRG